MNKRTAKIVLIRTIPGWPKYKVTQQSLADMFDTDQTNVSAIVNCRRWSHVA